MVEEEFAKVLRVMGRDGSTLSPVIRQAWDSGDLRIITKTSPAVATGAHISIIGHITRDELRRYLDSTEAGNGFANRFLWIWAIRSRYLPEGGCIHDVIFKDVDTRLRSATEFARAAGEIRRDEKARTIWHAVYRELSDGKAGLLGAVTSRAEAQVMRLACIYALLDKSDLIRKEHLNAALAVWSYAEASARHIFGDAIGDPIADQILAELRKIRELAGMTPDPWQQDLFESPENRILLNCSRQSGKSTVFAVLGLHRALTWPGSLVLLLSPSLRQSSEIFRKVLGLYRTIGDLPPPEAESSLRLELKNESRIVSLPGSEASIRGFSAVNLLILDEAARVEDAMLASVRPMLAVSGGRLIAASTPFGKRGWFYRTWENEPNWLKIKVTARECSRIDRVFLEEERRALGERAFAQEYLCEFAELVGAVFTSETVNKVVSHEVEPLFGPEKGGVAWVTR